jgi:hypothetical protein
MQSEDDPAPATTTEAQQLQPVPQTEAAKNRSVLVALVAAGLVAVAAAAGGGYMLWHRNRPVPLQPIPSQSPAQQSTAAPVAATDWAVAGADSKPAPGSGAASQPAAQAQNSDLTAAQVTPPATEQKPDAGVAATHAPSPAAAPGQTAAPAPHPQLPSLAFNPKKLDPKKSTRLKFDLGHFPPSLAFTVEMDGKTFFKGHAANKADYDGLFVPPGVHQFRIEARAGTVQKASNIVSANFIAKKHMTLKVELRPPPNGKAAAANLNPAAQIVASLKTDFFSF